jgi:hypothetical protein
MKLEVFTEGLQDYKELFNFFSLHNYTRFSRSDFIEYMNLLFDFNPFGKGIQVVARDKSNEMIGYMGFFSVPFSFNKKTIAGGQIVNILIHSNFRGQGIFLKLLEQLIKNTDKYKYEFIYGFPNPISYNGFKKLEWINKKLNYWWLKLLKISEFNIKYKYILVNNFETLENKDFDNEMFQINKNYKYLKWRFCKLGSLFEYYIFKILDDSENCLGYIILNEYKENQITYGQLIDAIIPIENFNVYNDLLNFYCKYFKEKDIFNLQFFLYSPQLIIRNLKSRNFSSYSKNRYFIYRSPNQNLHNAIKNDRLLLYHSSKDNV